MNKQIFSNIPTAYYMHIWISFAIKRWLLDSWKLPPINRRYFLFDHTFFFLSKNRFLSIACARFTCCKGPLVRFVQCTRLSSPPLLRFSPSLLSFDRPRPPPVPLYTANEKDWAARCAARCAAHAIETKRLSEKKEKKYRFAGGHF